MMLKEVLNKFSKTFVSIFVLFVLEIKFKFTFVFELFFAFSPILVFFCFLIFNFSFFLFENKWFKMLTKFAINLFENLTMVFLLLKITKLFFSPFFQLSLQYFLYFFSLTWVIISTYILFVCLLKNLKVPFEKLNFNLVFQWLFHVYSIALVFSFFLPYFSNVYALCFSLLILNFLTAFALNLTQEVSKEKQKFLLQF